MGIPVVGYTALAVPVEPALMIARGGGGGGGGLTAVSGR